MRALVGNFLRRAARRAGSGSDALTEQMFTIEPRPPAAGLAPWLKGLYVAPAAHRQGYGAILVRRCEAWARSLGHDALYLYTERGSGAQALYETLQWQVTGTGHNQDIDVTVMRTAL